MHVTKLWNYKDANPISITVFFFLWFIFCISEVCLVSTHAEEKTQLQCRAREAHTRKRPVNCTRDGHLFWGWRNWEKLWALGAQDINITQNQSEEFRQTERCLWLVVVGEVEEGAEGGGGAGAEARGQTSEVESVNPVRWHPELIERSAQLDQHLLKPHLHCVEMVVVFQHDCALLRQTSPHEVIGFWGVHRKRVNLHDIETGHMTFVQKQAFVLLLLCRRAWFVVVANMERHQLARIGVPCLTLVHRSGLCGHFQGRQKKWNRRARNFCNFKSVWPRGCLKNGSKGRNVSK